MQKYRSFGKLLLTGEYAVLDGALALAIPTRYGQDLIFTQDPINTLHWKSFLPDKTLWFETKFDIRKLSQNLSKDTITNTLQKILQAAKTLNPNFLAQGGVVKTQLEFPINWGLGSSSTLINNIASWARVNPFDLLALSFGGSGYDIACATSTKPLLYQIKTSKPLIKLITFNPPFRKHLYFVHLNQKQNSKKAIEQYQKLPLQKKQSVVHQLSQITLQITCENTLQNFQKQLQNHENVLSDLLQIPPVQNKLFDDYQGNIKSLGAWGGDFILAAGDDTTPGYFTNKGYKTVIPYERMILS